MDVIITYDLKRNHTEIKDALKKRGYVDRIDGVSLSDNSPVTQLLPNTTLIRFNALSVRACYDEVKQLITDNDGGFDRLFCAQLASGFNWNGY